MAVLTYMVMCEQLSGDEYEINAMYMTRFQITARLTG
jgi:hypothetical protein